MEETIYTHDSVLVCKLNTIPPVFKVIVRKPDSKDCWEAIAIFRKGHEPGLDSVTVTAERRDEAVMMLGTVLYKHFGLQVD